MSTDNPYMMMTIHSIIDRIACIFGNYFYKYLGCKRLTIISYFTSGVLYVIAGLFDQHENMIIFLSTMISARFSCTMGYNAQYLYAAEIYPTSIRSRAYAVRMAVGSLGNLIAPQVISFSSFPLVIFGIASACASAVMIFLPDTNCYQLPKSLSDGELIGLSFEERENYKLKHQNK